jgi:hypothetical protein
MLGVTCCYGARDFAKDLFYEGGLAYFVGYDDEYLWTDAKKLFRMNGDADPFWRAATAGCVALVEEMERTDVLRRMWLTYALMLEIYGDSRLDLLSRVIVRTCILNNMKRLFSVPWP